MPNNYEKQKKRNRLKTVLALFIFSLLFVIILLILILMLMEMSREKEEPAQTEQLTEAVLEAVTEEPAETEAVTEAATDAPAVPAGPAPQKETDIYTFSQGPKAWEAKEDFSGSWCQEYQTDQLFSVFGCGLCVLANIYSTLTPCECSPMDMFWYAQEASGYSPVSGYGAIDWPYMKQTLASVGISSTLRYKSSSYVRFRQFIERSIAAVVLISSSYDDTYWQNVEGHYVTIWLYDKETDTVFLSDSGNPAHNRQRIPLRYIYDALKKHSSFQYLAVTGVDPDGNTWQHDGISEKWNKPRYYRALKNRLK